MDSVIIVPDKGMAGEIGRQLLALTDNPMQVGWVSWPEAGFKVPRELADRFHAANKLDGQQDDSSETTPVKRRGRPPKAKPVTDTDEQNKEE